ncbi:hypothetical protein [Kineosporia babensis]|uniref:Chemotaxis methyl-accepting receptor HlyB-like 4HB MCP domain-containing protein n=1 Tax=Kineosporia babensis TaxID=499548 RepID=A0A9X1NEJ7_9ACTN|nr:hypothetical protein [Kineosporia babensis]MCD5313537.1 hypothetical protein [Kineosporia babensis]
MSQTVVPAPVFTRNVPAPPPSRLAEASQAIRASLSGSPGRLRLISLGAVACVVLSALLGGWALQMRASALDRAAASSAHLLLLQDVQTKLAQADAAATNSYLGFGLEPQEQRLTYLAALSDASIELAEAARHSGADAQALGQANAALNRYSAYVASARANNREGNPVGANYLESASNLMRDKIIPPLQERADADTADVKSAFSQGANARWLLLLAAVIGVGGLVYAQVLLTRHSHRYVNLPAAASTLGLVVVLIGAAVVMSSAQSEASDVRDGPLNHAIGLSTSRVAAFDAKAQESLTLINRGSADEEDKAWNDAFDKAVDSLDERIYFTAKTQLDEYGTAHQAINQTDVDGDWDTAVKQAISTADGSVNDLFQSYSDTTQKDLETQATAASDRLGDANDRLLPVALILLVVGLLCAGGVWWGVSLRLDEYR